MSKARVDEAVSRSFRLTADGLRDLDALLRQDGGDLTYSVERQDSLQFDTPDVETVLREHNGKTTAIKRLVVSLQAPPSPTAPSLDATVIFDAGVTVRAESDDRARVLMLAADLRALIRDRLQGRSSSPRSGAIRLMTPVVLWFVVTVGYLVANTIHDNSQRAVHDRAVQTYETRVEANEKRNDAALARASAAYRAAEKEQSQQALRALDGDERAMLEFLVRKHVTSDGPAVESLRRTTSPDYPEYPKGSWFFGSFLVLLFLGPAVAVIGALGMWAWPRADRVFLWGAQVEIQQRRERRRDRVVWGVGVTFLLGFAASVVSGRLG